MATIGSRLWAIPEGYIPSGGLKGERALVSHEAACILNAGEADAEIEITVYFTDQDPKGPYRIRVPSSRTRHLRFNDLTDPEPIPRDTDYACIIVSTQPVVVQHTRLDSRDPHVALLSTMAFAQ
ncbi:sensory rhodopsin transducer [Mesorhizobium sp. ES1-3]|uniref:sensory rhodopsin transducer n=1 Tax=Mesorhizobium sp. ES1-3 TaxID=2876628 RepID=UPI001CCDE63E|nr:sensory rhodopsin transducer [Mesorhizobium sp. ES1-3]MBZ9673660.1 sensory rhodopsin transducer [Mesorhizobium sp. ES1-3]